MKASELANIKASIKAELLRRDGFGSVAEFGGSAYDLSKLPTIGEKMRPEYGEKTIDLLLKICDYKDLNLTKVNNPVPRAFNTELIDFINNTLSKEVKTGESESTVKNLYPTRKAEASSCRGACTGLCVGSCIGQCNGCTNCTSSCGTGCSNGCNSTCSGGCNTSCNAGCSSTCTSGCNTTCSSGCNTTCLGGAMAYSAY